MFCHLIRVIQFDVEMDQIKSPFQLYYLIYPEQVLVVARFRVQHERYFPRFSNFDDLFHEL